MFHFDISVSSLEPLPTALISLYEKDETPKIWQKCVEFLGKYWKEILLTSQASLNYSGFNLKDSIVCCGTSGLWQTSD